jgi:hypothetical protein
MLLRLGGSYRIWMKLKASAQAPFAGKSFAASLDMNFSELLFKSRHVCI